jgi:hypothetical protein
METLPLVVALAARLLPEQEVLLAPEHRSRT